MIELREFQREFIAGATTGGVDTACLSLPRGNGKSCLAAHLVTRILSPDDDLFVRGSESVLIAGSIEQCRIVFRFARADLEPTGSYRFLDSATRCAITHRASGTRLRVHGSNARTAQGFVNTPWVIWDEPGAANVVGGESLWDAVATAQGKPGSPLKALLIGTLAPARSGWWHTLVEEGTRGSTYVVALQGDPERWSEEDEIRRCNPLVEVDDAFRKKLLEERDEARRDSRLKARFLSYRLNRPTADESEVLLTTLDWDAVCDRDVSERAGLPVAGIDMGAGRAWSSAVAVWTSGRVEAIAIAPGVPTIADQEVRDRVPSGTYQTLVDQGSLLVAEGLRVPPATMLVEAARSRWGRFDTLVCDRFRIGDVRDSNPGCPIEPRMTRWSESGADIRGLRKLAKDGPLSVAADSRDLLTASLAAALVKNDDAGNVRCEKRGSNNEARDDVAAALVLAAGHVARLLSRPPPTTFFEHFEMEAA